MDRKRLTEALLIVPAHFVVLAADLCWRPGRAAVLVVWRLSPLQRLHSRLVRLPPGVALPLFLVPEAASRGGWLLSAWLLLQGAAWQALLAYTLTKLIAGLTALWVYKACEPALLRVRWVARVHAALSEMRQAVMPANPRFAGLCQQIRDRRASRGAVRAFVLGMVAFVSPAMAQTDTPMLVQAEGQTLAPVCTGRNVQIEGNHDVIALLGICRSLVVKGVGNQVSLTLPPTGTIRVEGSGNRVTYQAVGAIPVVALGPDNLVIATASGAVVAPASGNRLDLAGDDQSLATDCAGRDVTVRGMRGFYLLRGGCRSVAIQGDLVTVQADLAPAATIAITGHGSTVAWAVPGRGKGPVITVRGEASRAQHIDAIGGEPVR